MSDLSRSLRVGAPPILCYVTDRQALSPGDASNKRASLSRKIETLLAAGIDWLQIREKDLDASEIGSPAREALPSAQVTGASGRPAPRIVVNDRLDVAIAVGAGGVHLGEKSLPVRDARSFVERTGRAADFLVGVSCHTVESVRMAANDGADYVFFGPVFTTPSKAIYGMPQGIERLADACRAVSIPVLAIGGISEQNFSKCMKAGAAGIAAIRLFQDAPDPTALIRALRATAK